MWSEVYIEFIKHFNKMLNVMNDNLNYLFTELNCHHKHSFQYSKIKLIFYKIFYQTTC